MSHTVPKGQIISRMIRKGNTAYDPKEDTGRYFAPDGVPFENRALPYHAEDYIEVKFEVIEPFSTNQSLATLWFNQPGMGIQHQITEKIPDGKGGFLDPKIQNLIKEGYISEIK